VFSSSFSITLPNIGKYFLRIHFPGIHFPKGNNFPANKRSLNLIIAYSVHTHQINDLLFRKQIQLMHLKQDAFLQKKKKEQQLQNPVLQKRISDFQIKIVSKIYSDSLNVF
jgi:hypothetical protein